MYKPHRDNRFEYVGDIIEFIESRQCRGCIHQNDEPDMPMCLEISGMIVTEEPVEALDDRGSDGVVCTAFVPHEAHPDQGRLL